jgi:enediyne biosynthesis protein E4
VSEFEKEHGSLVGRVGCAVVVLVVVAAGAGVGYLVVGNGERRSESLLRETASQPLGWQMPADGVPSLAMADCPIHLRDVTAQTGIRFHHTDGSSGRYYIPETVTAGVVTFDFDGDGWIDIYFPNGAPLPGAAPQQTRHALYRNLGDGSFVDVTEAAGAICREFGMGAVPADYDQDGFPDLYVSNFGANVLFRNNGDGTFTDVTEQAGVADGLKLGAGVCFLDANGDGNLDLFVANYLQFSYEKNLVLTRHGFPEYVGPRAYEPEKLSLYRNNGDGTFSDASVESGIDRYPGKGIGVICADYNQDGATDIFLLNDVFGNFCLRNDGNGRFEEIGLLNGFKYNSEGVPLGSMGIDAADYDNDGWLDFYQTSYQRELPVLFRNLGNGLLEDVTARTWAGEGTVNNVKWGCGFIDFDNDGHRDLFIAMGHLQDTIEHWDPPTTHAARNVLLRNTGDGRFVNVSNQSGDGLLAEYSSRGAAFDDLDNDGDIDVVILNSRQPPTVLRNMLVERGSPSYWLQVQLRGVKTNRDGVGTRISICSGESRWVDEVHAGRGYQGHFGSRLHFGLGSKNHVDRIEVHWIGGRAEVFRDFAANQFITLIEGRGAPLALRHRADDCEQE